MNLFPWLLFAHVLGAIIAFGPTFSSPIIGRMGARERAHGNFAMRVSRELARVQILPLAIVQGITGLGLVIAGNIDILKLPWLMIAIVLYLIAIGFAIFVQTPTVRRIIEMSAEGSPPGGSGLSRADRATAPAGGLLSGPPPELMPLVRRVQIGGLFLTALIVVIVFLMVVKPAF